MPRLLDFFPAPLLTTAVRVRPLAPGDVAAARALLGAESARHPYAARTLEILTAAAAALGAPGAEHRALVADEGDAVTGVVLYGLVAGTVGAGAIFGLAVARDARRRGVGRALVDAAADALATLGGRFAVAELADDASLGGVAALLASAGFAEEARASDLVRDGVGLRFLLRPRDRPARRPG
ncbi:MAG: GNAT family N-acetyltransferase [Gemmatimonadaceae bacterium]